MPDKRANYSADNLLYCILASLRFLNTAKATPQHANKALQNCILNRTHESENQPLGSSEIQRARERRRKERTTNSQ